MAGQAASHFDVSEMSFPVRTHGRGIDGESPPAAPESDVRPVILSTYLICRNSQIDNKKTLSFFFWPVRKSSFVSAMFKDKGKAGEFPPTSRLCISITHLCLTPLPYLLHSSRKSTHESATMLIPFLLIVAFSWRYLKR